MPVDCPGDDKRSATNIPRGPQFLQRNELLEIEIEEHNRNDSRSGILNVEHKGFLYGE